MKGATTASPLLAGLIPYDPIWAIRESYVRHFQNLAPSLYETLRDDPKRFARLARSGALVSETALALDLESVRRFVARSQAAEAQASDEFDDEEGGDPEPEEEAPYPIEGGVALLSVSGPMSRKPTSAMWLFGGTSTILFRRRLAHAHGNKRVGSVLIDWDTPGGTASGTAALADDIARVAKDKPVESYVEALCASAGYWGMSGSTRITVSRAALVGSIGVYMVIEDFSKMYADEGVTVHVVKVGEFKGAGEAGTEITPDQLAEWRRECEFINGEMRVSIMAGRNLSETRMNAVNTGQVWGGQELLDLGLADEIGEYRDVLSRMVRDVALRGGVDFGGTIPSASRSENGTSASGDGGGEIVAGPGSGYPKTGDQLVAVVGAAVERIEAERPASLRSEATGENAPLLADTGGTTQPTADGDEEGVERSPEPGDEAQPAGPGDAPENENDGEPPTAADPDTTEETMAETNTNATALDPALVAALASANITSESQFRALVAQAADGVLARERAITDLQTAITQADGAAATEGVDFKAIYGGWPLANLWTTAEGARTRHRTNMASNPANPSAPQAGVQTTTPPPGVSPALIAALSGAPGAAANGAPAAPNADGVAPVDPVALAARFNKEREEQAAASLGKK